MYAQMTVEMVLEDFIGLFLQKRPIILRSLLIVRIVASRIMRGFGSGCWTGMSR